MFIHQMCAKPLEAAELTSAQWTELVVATRFIGTGKLRYVQVLFANQLMWLLLLLVLMLLMLLLSVDFNSILTTWLWQRLPLPLARSLHISKGDVAAERWVPMPLALGVPGLVGVLLV